VVGDRVAFMIVSSTVSGVGEISEFLADEDPHIQGLLLDP
jgi:hypothetical protein